MSTVRRRRVCDPVPTAAHVRRLREKVVDMRPVTRDIGNMVAEEIAFEGRAGRRLSGSWHTPTTMPPWGAVVVAHGMLSSRASPKHRAMCEGAVASGLGSLRFDFAGRGESNGSGTDLTVSGEIDDLLAALAWVRDRLRGPVAIVGSSLGGTVAVLAAARTPVDALVTIAAPAELPTRPGARWTSDSGARTDADGADESTADVPSEFFDDAVRHDPVGAARTIRCPWLVIHGAADEVVPVRHAHMFAGACSTATQKVHPDAGHRFWSRPHRRWLVRRAIGFVADAFSVRPHDG